MIAWFIFFSHDSDVMVSTIHSRTHQVCGTCIYTDVLFVRMLFMDCFCHKASIRSKHKTAKLCVNRHIAHSSRNKNLFVHFSYTFTDHLDIVRFLIRFVRDSHTTGKVDELDMYTGLFLKLNCYFKQSTCKCRIIFISYSITCKECMDTELFCAFGLQDLECLKNLFSCHTVFGISRIIHNAVGNFEKSTRIITAADRLRNLSDRLFQKINVCDIVQVDDRAELISKCKFLCRCIIGRKHNIFSNLSDRLRH